MIVGKDKVELRRTLLMDAFKDEAFRSEVKKVSNDLYDLIKAWVESLEQIDPRIVNVFSVQSRVKEEDTFEEKIFRKNYIRDWDVSESKEENQHLIKLQLTDLIGIRINCFFASHESRLYNELQLYRSKLPECVLSFDENTEQANGHPIYKFSGIYKEQYHFEVQIKSIVHNVWGEVEHKTVYKNPSFDGYIEKKREIAEALYQVLFAADQELFSVFNMGETEDQLIRSLFFCKTKDIIREKCKTSILAYHYQRYFNIFKDISPYRQYVVDALSGREYSKKKIESKLDHQYDELIGAVRNEFPIFYLNAIYEIDSLINVHDSFDSFLYYFLRTAVPDVEMKDDFDDEFDKSTGWDDEEDEKEGIGNNADNNLLENYIEKLNGLLLKCRIKNNNK